MRKQGLMKRVLGGVMAVAFGAALCLATPVKAEAVDLKLYGGTPVYNTGEIWAIGSRSMAEAHAEAARENMQNIQTAMRQQLLWSTAYARTDALNKQTLSLLGTAYQLTSNSAIRDAADIVNKANLKAMQDFSDQVEGWYIRQLVQTDRMNENIYASQAYSQMAAIGASIGQLQRSMDNLLRTAEAQTARMREIAPYENSVRYALSEGLWNTGGYRDPIIRENLGTYPIYW